MPAFDSGVPDPSERRFPPGTVNGRLLEAILRHRHFVLRVENGVIADLLGPLRDAMNEVRGELANLAAREDALPDFSRLRRIQLIELERRIDAAMAFVTRETLARSLSDFRRFAEREIEIQARLLRREVPNGIALDLTGPPAAHVEALLVQPLGGKRWELRVAANYGELAQGLKRQLATSVMLGEGIPEAERRMQRVAVNVGRRRLVTLARSEIQRIANQAAIEAYRSNRGVIKAIQVLETLDDRTCLICATKDGVIHEMSSRDLPPYHASCRGFVVPVTRSLTEMGLSDTDFPASTRASMNGQVPDSVKYPEWFRGQSSSFQREILGPTRYRLFASGELSITDMVRDLRILPIDELPTFSVGAY